MPAIYHEGSWLGNATDPEVLVKDTVGWTGKNRAYSQTNNAVIAHIENGITYDVSWTGSATVTLKKNSTSGATITSGSTSPLSFTADADYELYFGSSATVTNIMVKDSRITDPTYEPYHESVEVMYEEEIHGVNLLKVAATSQTIGGITFTVNSDNSITMNGTSTFQMAYDVSKTGESLKNLKDGTYVVSVGTRLSSGVGFIIKKSDGTDLLSTNEQATFNVPNVGFLSGRTSIYIPNGVTLSNVTVKPMLRKADIDDPTYRPYNPQAIQNQLNAQGVLGAKNLLPNNATSQTINGVTFTVNDDGTITANGTATAVANFNISLSISDTLSCILNGCPSGGSDNSYRIGARYNNSGTLTYNYDTGNGCKINDISIVDRVFIQIASGQTVNNLVFKPMLRLASDPDDTYQPYAMTNRELTEEKINIADLKTVVSASSDFADFKTRIASL